MTNIERLQMNVNQAESDLINIKTSIQNAGVEVPDGTYTSEYASKVDEVYEVGKEEMRSHHTETTVSGKRIVVSDISELPHTVKCRVVGVENPETVQVTRLSKNLFNPTLDGSQTIGGVTVTRNADNSFSVKGKATATAYFKVGSCPLDYGVEYYVSGGTSDISLTVQLQQGETNIASRQTNDGVTTFPRIWSGKVYDNFNLVIVVSTGQEVDGIVRPMISMINDGTYEPYNAQTLIPSADGTVEGITSTFPQMIISTDNAEATLEVSYRQSKGKQSERDIFWNDFQMNGKRTNYAYAFRGLGDNLLAGGWNDNSYNPKYPIICGETVGQNASRGVNMFYYNTAITDTKVDIIMNDTALTNAFYRCYKLKTIRKLILNYNQVTFSQTFDGCSILENITIEGNIAANISFADCPLTKESILSILNALSTASSNRTLTLKLTAVNKAFETSENANDGSSSTEWISLEESKPNWTISLI